MIDFQYLTLWYKAPATNWMTEALPIGNGSFGGMIFGGVESERVQVNVDSLWTGDDTKTGAYQNLGDLFVELGDVGDTGTTEYYRGLDIAKAVHTVRYVVGGVTFTREAFCSNPHGVMVMRFTSDKAGVYSPEIMFKDAHNAVASADGATITCAGTLDNGLIYEIRCRVLHDGGTLAVDGGAIRLSGADALTLIMAADTSYVQRYEANWRGEHPHKALSARIEKAAAIPYDALRAAHVEDYRGLFDRFTLDLGTSDDSVKAMTTEQRLARYASGRKADPQLEALVCQYGRYLLISCSRPGTLPANLQGLWNHSNEPPWRCDYHSNINVQMNYWLAEPTNLAECHRAFADYVFSLRKIRGIRTREQYGDTVRGWTVRTENNIYGGASFKWNPPGSAWYAQHLWEHYAFGRDKAVLREIAYPVLKEICEFWEDRLKTRPDGTLVVPDGWSPEHGPTEEGVSFDQQLVYDLFSNYVEAARELGVDEDYRKRVAGMRAALLQPKIGRWGQLQEWEEDRDIKTDQHRHVSHLFALHPGRQITALTPTLYEAAKVSLTARGDGGSGWSRAWKISFWARLRDGDHAHRMLGNLMTLTGSTKTGNNENGGLCPNLFNGYPRFQMDGNFGATAGVAEMLLQSHAQTDDGMYVVHLLPALPSGWPKGSVKGLRARGGFEVDITWADDKLDAATLKAVKGTRCVVCFGDTMLPVEMKPGASRTFTLLDFSGKGFGLFVSPSCLWGRKAKTPGSETWETVCEFVGGVSL